MARTKAFDPTRALDRAVALFWCRGYSATSLADLLAAMQISRQSLYDTYGDKHRLFLAALDRYCAVQGREPLRPLSQGGSVRSAMRTMFHSMVAEAVAGELRGCLVVNTALECAPHDREIATRVATGVRATEDLFATAIRYGQEQGEFAASHDPTLLARYFMTFMHGLRVQAAARSQPEELYQVIDLTLDQLA